VCGFSLPASDIWLRLWPVWLRAPLVRQAFTCDFSACSSDAAECEVEVHRTSDTEACSLVSAWTAPAPVQFAWALPPLSITTIVCAPRRG